jgi:hypothetical protein
MVTSMVRLNPEEHAQFLARVNPGQAAAVTRLHARLLRNAEVRAGSRCWTATAMADAVDTRAATIHRVRQACVAQGLEAAWSRKRPTGRQDRTRDGAQEAPLIAVACRAPPEGRARWPLQLWADQRVALALVDTLRPAGVRTTRTKPRAHHGRSSPGCFPRTPTRRVLGRWKTCGRSTRAPPSRDAHRCASTRPVHHWWQKPVCPSLPRPGSRRASTTRTHGRGRRICAWSSNRWRANDGARSPRDGRPARAPRCFRRWSTSRLRRPRRWYG